jgi:hypothetical protein
VSLCPRWCCFRYNVPSRDAYTSLTNAIQHQPSRSSNAFNSTMKSPLSTSGNMVFQPLLNADYPHVKFWSVADFASSSDDKRQHLTGSHQWMPKWGRPGILNDENNSNRYMEDEQDVVVSAMRAAEARHLSCSIFADLHSKDSAPQSWMKVMVEATQYFRREMYQHFPKLWLCKGHWKVTRLAVDLYPGWRRSYVKDSVKKEQDDTKPSSLHLPVKRYHSRVDGARKRQKK